MVVVTQHSEMPRKQQPVAYLSLRMRYPAAGDDPLPDRVIDFNDGLEDSLRAVNLDGLEHSVTGSDVIREGGSVAFLEDEFFFDITEFNTTDRAEQEIVKRVRTHGIPRGYRFSLKKQIVLDKDERDVFDRILYQTRDTRWTKYAPPVRLLANPKKTTGFPKRVQYASTMAARCNGVGGKDIFDLFPKRSDLATFFSTLSHSDHAKLVATYLRIADNKDNEWLHAWLKDFQATTDDDYPEWVDAMLWMFAVLDRLREGGLLIDQKGASVPVLLYWDDYLGGSPYTETAV